MLRALAFATTPCLDGYRPIPVCFDILFHASNLPRRRAGRPTIENAAVIVGGSAEKRHYDRLFKFRDHQRRGDRSSASSSSTSSLTRPRDKRASGLSPKFARSSFSGPWTGEPASVEMVLKSIWGSNSMTKFSNPAVGANDTAPGSNTTLLDGVETLAILLLTVSLIPQIGKARIKYWG